MQHHFEKAVLTGLFSTALLLSGTAFAVEQGDWLARVGVGYVHPNDSSSEVTGLPGTEVTVGSAVNIDFTVAYMVTPNVNVELLASLPFKHDIKGKGTTANGIKIAETKQLPPTLMIDYVFNPQTNVRPYVGAGINYTTFFSTDTKGPLAAVDLDLDSSWGLAVQAGIDVDINEDWFLNASLWYMDINTQGTLGGGLGTVDVDINPYAFSLGLGTHF